MKGLVRQGGSATIAVLAVLTVMAASAAGGALLLRASLWREWRSVEARALQRSLEAEARRVAEALTRDPTPGADSLLDPVWQEAGDSALRGATVRLEDVSSRLNPNWVQKSLLSRTGLGARLLRGCTPEELQQRREDKGFAADIESGYGDMFQPGALATYCTSFAYANANVTDEFALRRLFKERTGDELAARDFHARIQALLMEKKMLRRDDLESFFGMSLGAIYPVMNVEPLMNVHFIDAMILEQILAGPDFHVPQPAQAAAVLLAMRDGTEITSADLERMIGAPAESRIYQYIGVTTWFWRIGVRLGSSREEIVVARIPSLVESPVLYEVIEERYSR